MTFQVSLNFVMEWTIRLNFKITIFGLSMYLWSEIFAKMCPTCKQNCQYHLQKTFTSKCSNLWSNLPFFKVWGRERPAKMAAVKFSRQISYFQLLCRRRRQVCLREYPFFLFQNDGWPETKGTLKILHIFQSHWTHFLSNDAICKTCLTKSPTFIFEFHSHCWNGSIEITQL